MYGKYKPTYRRKFGARKRYGAKRIKTYVRPVGSNNKNIVLLQKELSKVKAMVKKGENKYKYLSQIYDGRANHDATSPYRVIPLNNWRPAGALEPFGKSILFGVEESDINDSQKMIWKSTNIRCKLSLEDPINTEEENVEYDVFIVSIKDNAGDLIGKTDGALGPLLANIHYFNLGNKLTYLNKDLFNIHFHKHIYLGNEGASLHVPTSLVNHTFNFFNYKISHKGDGMSIEANVSNNWFNWRSMNHTQDPSKNYYMILFSDDNNIDQEHCHLNMTALTKFRNIDD